MIKTFAGESAEETASTGAPENSTNLCSIVDFLIVFALAQSFPCKNRIIMQENRMTFANLSKKIKI